MNEIIVFNGEGDLIYFYRDGKYIYLEKPDNNKVKYRFNLQTNQFERLNFYKTTDDKITPVELENMYSWFKDCKLVTKDLHFGRLVIFAKYNRYFERFSSPVRFIQQLGHRFITNIEKWESLGFIVEEVEHFFGEFQVKRLYSGPIDNRRKIFDGTVRRDYQSFYRGYITYGPQDFTKTLLNHLKREYPRINDRIICNFKKYYNEGEDIIENDLVKLAEDPEFGDCYDYTETEYGNQVIEKNLLMEDQLSFDLRMELISLIKEYNLDLEAVSKWIKRQRNVERNDIIFLFRTHHYRDYLKCEYDLKEGSLSRMVKYPKNFRTEFHRIQMEYAARKASIDKKRFANLHIKHSNLEYDDPEEDFVVLIPRQPAEIENEANELCHCVRTYIEPMTEGRTLILFLRRRDSPETPYVTLEIKNRILKQAYGLHDSKPSPEALRFLSEYCRAANVTPGCWKKEICL